MPGIVTHHRAGHEVIRYLPKKKKGNYLTRMLRVRFSDAAFRNAAFFGMLGPNMFDYLPCNRENLFWGSKLSFLLHGEGGQDVVSAMARAVKENRDTGTTWNNLQRGYLYGYCAHLLTDAVFHPYIYYWSGFPANGDTGERRFYREQHLMHEYNIDRYVEFYYETDNYTFRLGDMLPPVRKVKRKEMIRPVKSLILHALHEVYPREYKKIVWKAGKEKGNVDGDSMGIIDLVPNAVRAVYRLKHSKRSWLVDGLKNIRRNFPVYSDFIVQYPDPRRIEKHVLNLHRERWFYPAGDNGLHYESVEDLLRKSRDLVIDYLEQLEYYLMPETEDTFTTIMDVLPDALTGTAGRGAGDMTQQNPHKLRY